jgi:hypothetical protein
MFLLWNQFDLKNEAIPPMQEFDLIVDDEGLIGGMSTLQLFEERGDFHLCDVASHTALK